MMPYDHEFIPSDDNPTLCRDCQRTKGKDWHEPHVPRLIKFGGVRCDGVTVNRINGEMCHPIARDKANQ